MVEERVFLLKEEVGKTADTPFVISPEDMTKTCHIHTTPVIEEPVEPEIPEETPSDSPLPPAELPEEPSEP